MGLTGWGFGQVLSAALMLRVDRGPQPRAELAEIRRVTQQALASPLLVVYPALYQYSADETPHQQSGQRLAYPDFSRWRHCIRKVGSLATLCLTGEHARLSSQTFPVPISVVSPNE